MDSFGSTTSGAGPGWYADPARRHQLRFWSGAGWTDDVIDNGIASRDPLTASPPVVPIVQGFAANTASGYAAGAAGYPAGAPGYAAAGAPYAAGVAGAPGYAAAGAPYAAEVAGAPATVAGGRSPARIAGCLIAVVGGAGVIVASVIDWFSGGGMSMSGWDFYDLRSKVDQNVWVIGDMFDDDSPLFTGLTTLVVGIVLVAIALLLLALPGSRRPGARELNAGVGFVFVLLASLLQIPGIVNLVSWLASGSGKGATAEFGFYLVIIGGALAWIGILIAAIGKRRPAW